jgi:autotransporter-associated beta strand protein
MKTKLTILKLTILVCGTVVTTAVFGQTTWTWTAAGTAPTNLYQAANWSPAGGPPVPNNSDWMEFNGVTGITPQILTMSSSGAFGDGVAWGLTAWLTANQTALVQFGTRGGNNSGTIRMKGIQLDPGAGPFILGDNDNTHIVDLVWGGVAGQVQDLVNNSTSLATILPNAQFRYGGGGTHDLYFDGTGNWQVNHYLITANGSGTALYKVGTGIMWWYGTNAPVIPLNSSINSPVVFNEGTIVLETSDLLTSQAIANNGSDPVWLQYNAPTDSRLCNLSGIISGPISVSVLAGNLQLSGANTYTGATTVSNGMLVVNSVGGDMDVSGGTLAPAAAGTIGTLTVAGNMNLSAGTVLATLNKALSPSNTSFVVAGAINSTGGTLKLLNYGPALVAGDKFQIFNQAVTGSMTVLSPGFTVVNNGDGSFTVQTVAPAGSGVIAPNFSGGHLNLSWPAIWTGLHVQVQTNALAKGLGTNWVTIPGTDGSNSYSTTPNNSNGSVFYRLAP